MKTSVLMCDGKGSSVPQFVKILAGVTEKIRSACRVEIRRSAEACFWPIVVVCVRRFERAQRVGKR
jgi:hypothetical protein